MLSPVEAFIGFSAESMDTYSAELVEDKND
jgi:hypothetical protein